MKTSILTACGTTYGIVRENDRCCGRKQERFGDVRLLPPNGYREPIIAHVPSGGGLYYVTVEGPDEQVEALIDAIRHMDHYSAIHSSMRSGVALSERQTKLVAPATCVFCR
jgi:hypothetical protein